MKCCNVIDRDVFINIFILKSAITIVGQLMSAFCKMVSKIEMK
jgi:hypothetical protein